MAYFLDNVPPSQDTSIYPVGATYTQYYGESTPASLFGGTWTDITSTITQGVIQVHSSGSNSNGSWIRYTDGTMMCWGYNISLPTGVNQSFTTNYPINFTNDYSTGQTFTYSIVSNAGNYPTSYVLNGYPTTSQAGILYTVAGSLCRITWQAIGKWSSAPVYPTTIWRRTSTATSSIASPTNIVTGIYDSGTNSNGSWIRFTDGTMQCWGTTGNILTSNSSAIATIFYGLVAQSFPQSFSSTPNVTYTPQQVSGFGWGMHVSSVSTSGFTGGIFSESNTYTTFLYWQAIGKWR